MSSVEVIVVGGARYTGFHMVHILLSLGGRTIPGLALSSLLFIL
jgi:hypothetical protein